MNIKSHNTMKRFIVRPLNSIGLYEVHDTLMDTKAFTGDKKRCTHIAKMMNGGL